MKGNSGNSSAATNISWEKWTDTSMSLSLRRCSTLPQPSYKRDPAWTDRILFATDADLPEEPDKSCVDVLLYTSIPSYTTSDHVSDSFSLYQKLITNSVEDRNLLSVYYTCPLPPRPLFRRLKRSVFRQPFPPLQTQWHIINASQDAHSIVH